MLGTMLSKRKATNEVSNRTMTSFFYLVVVFALILLSQHPPSCSAFSPHGRRSVLSSRLAASEESSSSSAAAVVVDDALFELANGDSTQTKLSPEQAVRFNDAIESIPVVTPSLDVNGGWKLLATISPEAM